MIVCGHSKVEISGDVWRIEIPEKIRGVVGVFPGQTLFGAYEHNTGRLLVSPLRLTPTVSYFRMFLDDVRGSLAQVTKLFSDRDVNILSGGAFGFGNIWVSELLADFDKDSTPDEITSEIQTMGGFVTSREITELFPRTFTLNTNYVVEDADGKVKIASKLAGDTHIQRSGYAVLKAWPRIRAIFIDFFTPDTKLVHLSAKIKDVPGSLTSLTEMVGSQINMNAIDELHHDEQSGVWNAYGEIKMGEIKQLREKAAQLSNILKFEVNPLGWS